MEGIAYLACTSFMRFLKMLNSFFWWMLYLRHAYSRHSRQCQSRYHMTIDI